MIGAVADVAVGAKPPHDDQSVTVERYRIARVTVESHAKVLPIPEELSLCRRYILQRTADCRFPVLKSLLTRRSQPACTTTADERLLDAQTKKQLHATLSPFKLVST